MTPNELSRQEEHLFAVLSGERFLKMEGLSNEVPFFIYPYEPEHANEISGLLIMGVAGGAIIPLLMGIASDSFGQTGGMALLLVTLVYLLYNAYKMKEEQT